MAGALCWLALLSLGALMLRANNSLAGSQTGAHAGAQIGAQVAAQGAAQSGVQAGAQTGNGTSSGGDVPAWNLPRFGEDAGALYKAASEVTTKAGTEVVVLDDEEKYVFDADGKAVHTKYLVYKVLTQGGAEGWDEMSVDWQPWNEEKPTLRARVITPDGAVHVLDQKTISDAPAKDDDEKVYGDTQVRRAPLPAIAPGSVVEEEDVTKESAPFFGAGVVERTYFGRPVPVRQAKLTLDFPNALPVRYTLQLLPEMKPQRSEADGRVQVEFVQRGMEPLDKAERLLPSEVPSFPAVTFATGASWQAVAAGYAKLVDDKAETKDVRAVVEQVVKGKSTAEEKAAAIVEYLNREIRYTGVEFGDAAIVPHTPAETLKRKYGDCKDKATLEVTMLRAAGVPAYVALLNAGSREDVEKDLPGMGMFDHAIVYVPGSPDWWIDATDEYAGLGQVPSSDQGRQALVARAETTGLIRIPEAQSAANRVVENREFYLAESGPARVVETTTVSGVFDSEYRAFYATEKMEETRKNLKEYMEGQYLAEKLSRMEQSNPADLTKPFQMVLEGTGAKRGITDLDSAVAAVRLESLFDKLPNELQGPETPEKKTDAADTEKPKKPRTADYALPEAFVYEWRYRIVPPVGFQAKPVPADEKIAVGPAVLTEEFKLESDGSVRAVFRFDTVKRRFTVAEATELRTKVGQLRSGQAIFVYFEPTTEALLEQGKAREAFQFSRGLIAAHPKDAVYHLQRAKALLTAGMGEAARREAREAVKLEPNSAVAQKTLGLILEYDLLGRQFRRGSDYAGAEASYRAAVKLAPDEKENAGNLAILLEYNSDGERYGPGAKLREAVEAYKSLKDEDRAKIGLQNNLAFALFYAGEYAEAKAAAENVNPQLSGVIVASEAALRGPEAGLTEARKRTGNEAELKTVAKAAGEALMRARKYPAAAALYEVGASGSTASGTIALAGLLRKAQVHEQMKLGNTPVDVVMRTFLLAGDPHLTMEKMNSLNSRNANKVTKNADADRIEKTLRTGRSIRPSLSKTGFPADIMLDVVLVTMQPQVEGDDATGYRVKITMPGTKKIEMFVVKEDGQYRILDSDDEPNAIGLEILDKLNAGNVASARVLLDWLREDQHLGGGDDPLAGAAFPRLWTKGKEATPEEMRVAAGAILVQTRETAQEGLAILEAALGNARNEDVKLNMEIALLGGYANVRDYEKLASLSAEIAKHYPESMRVFRDQEMGLRGLGRFAGADALAQEMSKRLPDDLDVQRAFVFTAVAKEDYARAHALGQKMVADGKAEAGDFNSVAWNALFTGKVEAADLDDATKSAQLSQNAAGILHTLGCVYAEMGKTKEAHDILDQAMDALILDEPDANYWYGFGRVAEQYGETEIATADYQHVKKPEYALQVPGSSYRLAQMRLAAIGAAGKRAGTD
jgi:transglutaminase-like putative cysteine protease/Flp pilus assembly protein TadD